MKHKTLGISFKFEGFFQRNRRPCGIMFKLEGFLKKNNTLGITFIFLGALRESKAGFKLRWIEMVLWIDFLSKQP